MSVPRFINRTIGLTDASMTLVNLYILIFEGRSTALLDL